MATSDEILALKQAYADWQSLPTRVEYGPLRAFVDHDRVQRLWRETIEPAAMAVHESAERRAAGVWVATAPSPWHAFFYLRMNQQYVYRAGQAMGEPLREDESPGDHLFFRGQRCADWETVSSLRRKRPEEQDAERLAVAALEEYFRSKFVLDESLVANTAACFAQHYGIATDLTDVSCDADVAVWFATHPVDAPCASGEPEALVQAVSWAGQAGGSEARCLLPPPFVRNVYRQRGLFVDASETGGRLRGELSLEVRFPRATAGGEFELLREGRRIEVWPERDPVETELVEWARALGRECADEESARKRAKDREPEPRFWLDRELWDPERHIEGWLGILDWALPATCVTARPAPPGSAEPMNYFVLDSKVGALVRANPGFFRALVRAREDAELHPVLAHVLDRAKVELER